MKKRKNESNSYESISLLKNQNELSLIMNKILYLFWRINYKLFKI